MRRALAGSLLLLGALAVSSSARAQSIEQANQVMFGAMVSYVPQQNRLGDDVLAIGHYVSYSHRLDFFFVGLRASMAYGWLPSGAPGQQWVLEGDGFIGGHVPIGKRFALRLEAGLGPLLNGGEGFSMAGGAHAYLRAAAQLVVVKSVTVEAFGGPSFLLGQAVAGVFPELGLGCGWNF
ncbi:MAG TPA: hypothetical protein VLM85_17365 [Polyangiaceae bacterium]|nr:hypothetical protein [Polyangiaceae bacterium]